MCMYFCSSWHKDSSSSLFKTFNVWIILLRNIVLLKCYCWQQGRWWCDRLHISILFLPAVTNILKLVSDTSFSLPRLGKVSWDKRKASHSKWSCSLLTLQTKAHWLGFFFIKKFLPVGVMAETSVKRSRTKQDLAPPPKEMKLVHPVITGFNPTS